MLSRSGVVYICRHPLARQCFVFLVLYLKIANHSVMCWRYGIHSFEVGWLQKHIQRSPAAIALFFTVAEGKDWKQAEAEIVHQLETLKSALLVPSDLALISD